MSLKSILIKRGCNKSVVKISDIELKNIKVFKIRTKRTTIEIVSICKVFQNQHFHNFNIFIARVFKQKYKNLS